MRNNTHFHCRCRRTGQHIISPFIDCVIWLYRDIRCHSLPSRRTEINNHILAAHTNQMMTLDDDDNVDVDDDDDDDCVYICCWRLMIIRSPKYQVTQNVG